MLFCSILFQTYGNLSLSFSLSFLSLSYFLLYLFQQPGNTLISLYKIRTDEKSTSGHLQISTQWEDYKRKGEITIKMMKIKKKPKTKKQLFNTQNVHRKTNILLQVSYNFWFVCKFYSFW